MDTQTGKIINLLSSEEELTQAQFDAWKAGLLKEKPRYIPIEKGFITHPFNKLTRK